LYVSLSVVLKMSAKVEEFMAPLSTSPVSSVCTLMVMFWTWYTRSSVVSERVSSTSLPLEHILREQSTSVYIGSQRHARDLPASQSVLT